MTTAATLRRDGIRTDADDTEDGRNCAGLSPARLLFFFFFFIIILGGIYALVGDASGAIWDSSSRR
jgi:hypothetical protein